MAAVPAGSRSKEHQSADEVIRAEKLNGHLYRQAEYMYCVHLLVL
jgi:hypothetical protein